MAPRKTPTTTRTADSSPSPADVASAEQRALEARRQAQAEAREAANSRAGVPAEMTEGGENDGIARAPDTMPPGDRTNWNNDPVGETSQDPLGVGQNPSNLTADPTDTRAVGKGSNSRVEARERPGVERRDRPTHSPDPQSVTMSIPVATAVTPENPLGLRPRKIEYLDGETVQLMAPHYINDVLYDEGTVLEDYTGPKSRNMVVVKEGEDFTLAATRQADREKSQQQSFRVRAGGRR